MKSDVEWFEEFKSWPYHSEHKMIRAIQADTLRHAAELCIDHLGLALQAGWILKKQSEELSGK